MEIMNIYAEDGDKVVYCFPENGYLHDKESCNKHLKLNQVYTVKYTKVGQSNSRVSLKEVPNMHFNTVMFADHKDDAIIPNNLQITSYIQCMKDRAILNIQFSKERFPASTTTHEAYLRDIEMLEKFIKGGN